MKLWRYLVLRVHPDRNPDLSSKICGERVAIVMNNKHNDSVLRDYAKRWNIVLPEIKKSTFKPQSREDVIRERFLKLGLKQNTNYNNLIKIRYMGLVFTIIKTEYEKIWLRNHDTEIFTYIDDEELERIF